MALPAFLHALPVGQTQDDVPDGEQTTLPTLSQQSLTDAQQDVSRDMEEDKSRGPTFTTPDVKTYPENDSLSQQTSSETEPTARPTSQPGSSDVFMTSVDADDKSTSAPASSGAEQILTDDFQPLDGEAMHAEDDQQSEDLGSQPGDRKASEEDTQTEKLKQISLKGEKPAERTPQMKNPAPSNRALHSSNTGTTLRNNALCTWTWNTTQEDVIYRGVTRAVCDPDCHRCSEKFGSNYSCQAEMRGIYVVRRQAWWSGNIRKYSSWYLSSRKEIVPVACVCAKNA